MRMTKLAKIEMELKRLETVSAKLQAVAARHHEEIKKIHERDSVFRDFLQRVDAAKDIDEALAVDLETLKKNEYYAEGCKEFGINPDSSINTWKQISKN